VIPSITAKTTELAKSEKLTLLLRFFIAHPSSQLFLQLPVAKQIDLVQVIHCILVSLFQVGVTPILVVQNCVCVGHRLEIERVSKFVKIN